MQVNTKNISPVENPPGIYRRTLTWNDELMLCHFDMKKGAKIPLHNHRASQNGYVISGKIRFLTENEPFTVRPGDAYNFGSNEKHGAEILEDSIVVETFSPSRPEYERPLG
ncbi:MAG: cupin [Promethearchaeota archaeon CR_4]|nr:MAG: cupin [Candidatus Lokiarchaeota archaeon CR_4]